MGNSREGEEEEQYESDPDDARLTLTMRRREASDDEEGDEPSRFDLGVGICSDGESDGQGGAAVYEDDEELEIAIEDEEDEVEEEEFDEVVSEGDNDAVEIEVPAIVPESDRDERRSGGESIGFHDENQTGEKKENEPFAVPTAGAFYMHDDRFRDSGGGRHRRTPGGRKLWESKDDRKWGHDKFEEMNTRETHYEKERKNSRGHYRGRGKIRGLGRGNVRGNRSRAYEDRSNQNNTFKSVRGRGPRRYEPPAMNRSETLSSQNKQSGKSLEATSITSSGRVSTHVQTANVQYDPIPPRKHVFASSLSVSSPPFYPSSSSNQDISVTQKRDLQVGGTNKKLLPSLRIQDKFHTPHSNASLRGKTVADSTGQDRLYIDDSIHPIVGKLTNLQLQSSGQSRPKGKGSAISGQLSYLSTPSNNQVSRVSHQTQFPTVNQRLVQSPVQASLKVSTQQLGQHLVSRSQASSPPKASPTNSSELGEMEFPPESSNSNGALVGKGKGSIQGSGRGSFLYSGGMGVPHGDQNFPGTPALLPVMQFGGQHPGGLGVPAVGMALPGYVTQSQLGLGNSEMTWLPFLAGAAGALGAAYCPPYLAVDGGGYYARQSGQISSSGVSSKETGTNKPNNTWKPPERPEVVNEEFEHRQNKPRRYSEMNFGQ